MFMTLHGFQIRITSSAVTHMCREMRHVSIPFGTPQLSRTLANAATVWLTNLVPEAQEVEFLLQVNHFHQNTCLENPPHLQVHDISLGNSGAVKNA